MLADRTKNKNELEDANEKWLGRLNQVNETRTRIEEENKTLREELKQLSGEEGKLTELNKRNTELEEQVLILNGDKAGLEL